MATEPLTHQIVADKMVARGREIAEADSSAYESAWKQVNAITPDEAPYYVLGLLAGAKECAEDSYKVGVSLGELKGAISLIQELVNARKKGAK